MKALERPSYLNKNPEQKFWEIQIEYRDVNKEQQCSFHFFNCSAKAAAFARSNRVGFDANKDFFYSDVEKVRKRRGVKHF
ncbi:MAG: hypothetical protein ACK56B_14565 [Dolichospermum sp.]|jgi:hypothetical protein